MSTPHTPAATPGELRPLRARAIRTTLVSLVGTGGTQSLRLVSNVVLTRLLFPEAFGLMAIVRVVMNGLSMISDVGVQESVVRHARGNDPAFLNTAWTIQIVRGLVLWVMAASIAHPLAEFYDEPQLLWLVPAATSTILISSLRSTRVMTMVREMTVGRVAITEFVGRLVGLVAMIGTAVVYPTVWVLVLGAVVSEVVRVALSYLLIPGIRNHFAWDRGAVEEIISFGKWVLVSTLIGFIAGRFDVMLLSKLLDLEMLGIYSIAVTMASIPRLVLFQVSRQVLEPVFAASNLRSRETLVRNFEKSRRLTAPLGMVAILGAVAGAPAFFNFLYDERYQAAGWIAQLSLIQLWFTYLQTTASRAFPAVGDSFSLATTNSIKFATTTVGCAVGWWLGGIAGLMIGMGAANLVAHYAVVRALAKHGLEGFRYDALYSGLAMLLGATVGLLPYYWLPDADPRTIAIATLVVGAVVCTPPGVWVLLKLRAARR